MNARGTAAIVAMLAAAGTFALLRRLGTPLDQCVTVSALASAATVDARRGILPDALTLGAACCVFAIAGVRHALADSVVAAVIVALPFAFAAAASRSTAIGWGDVKAMLSVGAAFGVLPSCRLLLVASTSGLLFALARRLGRRSRLAFGPHLAVGAACTSIFTTLGAGVTP
ncbi:MAG: prepilin peptidase [Candidatus Eremiobacteraeota bacterium]|nr:prepilin peptidase [Candidatus Eremiobacteraeota bacterium]